MRLFHFSEDPSIKVFSPRPVRVSSERTAGREWLNGSLVWAIDEDHQSMYLFPRECPRILLWATPQTSPADRNKWWGDSSALIIAYIEASWLDRISAAHLHRYEFSDSSFENLQDAGMWVSREAVLPLSVICLENLPEHLKQAGVEVRVQETLTNLRKVWDTSLHASGIRLRNAVNWA